MPMIGVPLRSDKSINGLSWLGVDPISSLLFFTITQAHPLPKRFIAASLNIVLNFSKFSNEPLIASATLPVGIPPPPGFINFQKKEWFQCPPPLLRTAEGYFEMLFIISSREP